MRADVGRFGHFSSEGKVITFKKKNSIFLAKKVIRSPGKSWETDEEFKECSKV